MKNEICLDFPSLFLIIHQPPMYTLFPYTTLFRSDPTDEKGVFKAVDVKAVEPLPRPVTLAEVKAEPSLKDMILARQRSEEHTSELQSRGHLVCRLLLEKKNQLRHHKSRHPRLLRR